MVDHPRKIIRQAFKDRLIKPRADGTFRTRAENRIFPSRMASVTHDELKEDGPCILIYARMEKQHADKDFGPQGDATYIERELILVTEAMLLANDDIDDKLDDIAIEIEAAINDFVVPGVENARIRLIESDIDMVHENVMQPIGCIGLVWQINYRTEWRARPGIDNIAQPIDAFLAGADLG
jgi:hypothetical protein